MLKVIGKGSFGKVVMARKNDTGAIYAIKILKKEHLSQRGGKSDHLICRYLIFLMYNSCCSNLNALNIAEIEHTVAERKILAQNTNPFLVSLKFSFQTSEKIYFVLDYVCGGELFVHLQVR